MFRVGQQLGDYRLVKELGKGGFGEVWLADTELIKGISQVAIKLPRHEQVDWQAITQEIGLWVLCGKHKNLLPFIEAKVIDGQIAIISEYASGGSLRDVLDSLGELPIQAAVEVISEVLDGLAHLHSNGIIHRDLKPENILLQENTPRLADFGISRIMTVNSSSQTVSGTYWYMAPEAFNGKRNAQTDIWSVGVILYELLKGEKPFPQRELTALIGAIAANEPEPLPDSIPPSLKEVTMKALAKQAQTRYATAMEMRRALLNIHITEREYSRTERGKAAADAPTVIIDGRDESGTTDSTLPDPSAEEAIEFYPGLPVRGTIVDFREQSLVVDFGYKSQGLAPLSEFVSNGEPIPKLDDQIRLVVKVLENHDGYSILSRTDAFRQEQEYAKVVEEGNRNAAQIQAENEQVYLRFHQPQKRDGLKEGFLIAKTPNKLEYIVSKDGEKYKRHTDNYRNITVSDGLLIAQAIDYGKILLDKDTAKVISTGFLGYRIKDDQVYGRNMDREWVEISVDAQP